MRTSNGKSPSESASWSPAGSYKGRSGVRPRGPSDKNIHEIEAEGDFGKLFVRMENVPSPTNPNTSHMAALSAIALLRRVTTSLVVGT